MSTWQRRSDRPWRRPPFDLAALLPHAGVAPDNPAALYELRRLPRADELRRRTVLWMGWLVAVAAGLWFLQAAPLLFQGSSNVSGLPDAYYDIWSLIAQAAGLLALADATIFNFAAILAGLNSISDDARMGRWDLICITDVPAAAITSAKHCAAQLRVWWMACLFAGARLGVLVAAGLHLLLGYILPYGPTLGWPRSLWEVLTAVLLALIVSALGLMHLCEIFWRLRIATAAGLAISARLPHPSSAVLSTAGALLKLWAQQLLVIIVLALTFYIVFAPPMEWVASESYVYDIGSAGDLLFYPLTFAAVCIFGLLIRAFYAEMVRSRLTTAQTRLIERGAASPPAVSGASAWPVLAVCLVGPFVIWLYYAAWIIFTYRTGAGAADGSQSPLPVTYSTSAVMIGFLAVASIFSRYALDRATVGPLSNSAGRRGLRAAAADLWMPAGRKQAIFSGLRLAALILTALHYALGLHLLGRLTAAGLAAGAVVITLTLAVQYGEIFWRLGALEQAGLTITACTRRPSLRSALRWLALLVTWLAFMTAVGCAVLVAQWTSSRPLLQHSSARPFVLAAMIVIVTGLLSYGAHALLRQAWRTLLAFKQKR